MGCPQCSQANFLVPCRSQMEQTQRYSAWNQLRAWTVSPSTLMSLQVVETNDPGGCSRSWSSTNSHSGWMASGVVGVLVFMGLLVVLTRLVVKSLLGGGGMLHGAFRDGARCLLLAALF